MKYANQKIAFFGTRPLGVRCLEYLLTIPYLTIVAVATLPKGFRGWWSQSGTPEVYEIAERHGIRVLESEEELCDCDVDLGISTQYMKILEKKVFTYPRNGFINLHPALLPYYRGRNGFTHAILNGEKKFGATLHYMNEKADEGPIIKTVQCNILPDMTARDLFFKVESLAYTLFRKTFPLFLKQKRLYAVSQEKITKRKSIQPHYYSKDSLKDMGEVDIMWDPGKIYDYVRAFEFPPFAPAYIKLRGNKKIYLTTKIPFQHNEGQFKKKHH